VRKSLSKGQIIGYSSQQTLENPMQVNIKNFQKYQAPPRTADRPTRAIKRPISMLRQEASKKKKSIGAWSSNNSIQ
jgi:hypothetical protein